MNAPRTTSSSTGALPDGRASRDQGFTLVELLVAMTLFLVLSALVLTSVMSMSRGVEQARVTADVTAEARLALTRIAREVRQAKSLESITETSMTVNVDFNGDRLINGTSSDPERITYEYSDAGQSIAMTAKDAGYTPVTVALLAGHVKSLTFEYRSSNWAKYAPTQALGNANVIDVDRVKITLVVERDGRTEQFQTQVTLRNRSQS